MNNKFGLRKFSPLIAACGIAFAESAAANSGHIDFVSGNVTAQALGSQPRALAKGSEVRSGDTVRTNDGMVQIRYPDGAFVSLRPDTEYTIENYRFEGKADGSEQGLFKLLKGTMRTVTGLVGRVNRANYRITTPTATIGIRGTGGVIAVNGTTGATTVIGTSGVWDLRAQTGTPIPVAPGQTGRTTSTTQPAEQVSADPGSSSTSQATQQSTTTTKTEYSTSENRTSSGSAAAVDNAKSYTGISLAVIGNPGSGVAFATQNTTSVGGHSDVKVSVDSSDALTGFVRTNTSSTPFTETATVIGGTLTEHGTTGPVVWGRIVNATLKSVITGSSSSTTNYTVGSNGGIAYAAGESTVDMPKSGSFTYNMANFTRPSFKSEAAIIGSVTSSVLTGTFSPTGGSITTNTVLNINSQNYTMMTSGSIFNSGFSTSGNTTGGACTSCSSFMNGAFYGTGASYAAGAYQITLPGDTLNGVLIYKK